jgi:hypothetical protein
MQFTGNSTATVNRNSIPAINRSPSMTSPGELRSGCRQE